ncbi:MAG TPA: hypothetical protein VL069_12350, partial [Opitutus sp.]|nr:hypothetical protein [Opitutus sp.]
MKMKLHGKRPWSWPSSSLRFGCGWLGVLLFTGVGSFAAEAAGGITEATLAARSGPRKSTMFTTLSPQQTGLVTENNYSDPKMWTEHYQELIYGAIG